MLGKETDPKEFYDKSQIVNAIREFASQMEARMLAKYDEGLRGWDDIDDFFNFYALKKIDKNIRDRDWLDVANFAMMLHRFDCKGEK